MVSLPKGYENMTLRELQFWGYCNNIPASYRIWRVQELRKHITSWVRDEDFLTIPPKLMTGEILKPYPRSRKALISYVKKWNVILDKGVTKTNREELEEAIMRARDEAWKRHYR